MQSAAARLLAIRKASTSFLDYINLRHPDWEKPDFHLQLINTLDLLEKNLLFAPSGNPINNLLITMPPRYSKSTYSTVEFPSYYIGRDPRRYVMTTSYNAELATDFGREVRNIIATPEYTSAFPNTTLAKDSQSAATWRTSSGGAYFGMGLGGSTSGRPANMLIVDDPYKNRIDAESPTVRRKVWSYYQSALATRLQPTHNNEPPKQIIIHTRWHPDDLIGQIQRLEDFTNDEWATIEFKAITLDEDNNEVPLWPERFPLEALHRMRRLNPREFEALYQQSPYIEGGNILQTNWWQYYPKELKPSSFASLIIAVDTAFKKNTGNDYSVAIPMGLTHEGDIFILDVIRERFTFPELKDRLIALNAQYRGYGLRATYIEDLASGQSLIQELRRSSGVSVIPYRAGKDKETRVNAITPIIQGGRVFLPDSAPWLDDFLKEAEAFPLGSFDDQIDAATMGIDILSKASISPDDAFAEGSTNSLLQEYNQSRDLILGNTGTSRTRGSLNEIMKSRRNIKWNGWGQ